MTDNLDSRVVSDFGVQWRAFSQESVSLDEMRRMFDAYFAVFPDEQLTGAAVGFDAGCGTGRWARFVAPRVAVLHCIDPSGEALEVARKNLAAFDNVQFHHVGVDALPMPDGSMDFGYSLGVLHHVPDTARGITDCVRKLKHGAPFLVYLYYGFDNKPAWFAAIFRAADLVRRGVCRLPYLLKYPVTQAIALLVYWPLARLAAVAERLGLDVGNMPLNQYRDRSLYSMRTDALDRFGTRLEQRFTRVQIAAMMTNAGLVDIRFSAEPPFWCAVGYRS